MTAVTAATAVPAGGGIITFYEIGKESYNRLIAYDDIAYGSSVEEAALRSRVEAYLRLADWNLLYAQNGAALEQYAEVYEVLAKTDFAPRLIAEVFAPAIPTVLPTFLPNPLETELSARYIEASFEVTKYGESRRVEIVGATRGVSAAAKDDQGQPLSAEGGGQRARSCRARRRSLLLERLNVHTARASHRGDSLTRFLELPVCTRRESVIVLPAANCHCIRGTPRHSHTTRGSGVSRVNTLP